MKYENMQYSKIIRLREEEWGRALGVNKNTYNNLLNTIYSNSKNRKINKRYRLSTPERLMLTLEFIMNPLLYKSLKLRYQISNDEFLFSINFTFEILNLFPEINSYIVEQNKIDAFKSAYEYESIFALDIDNFVKQVGFTPLQLNKMIKTYISAFAILWKSNSYLSINLGHSFKYKYTKYLDNLKTAKNRDGENDIYLKATTPIFDKNTARVEEIITISDMEESLFFKKVGIAKSKFIEVLKILEHYFSKPHNKKLSIEDRFLIFLDFLLRHINYTHLAKKYNVTPLTVMNSIKFIDYILKNEKIAHYPGLWEKGMNEKEYNLKLELFLSSDTHNNSSIFLKNNNIQYK